MCTMVFDTELPKSLWPYVVAYACHLKNRSPTCALKEKTPVKMFYNKKPDISSVRIFGCDMWVLNQDHKGKLNPCSHKYKFLGLLDETCACWYYKPKNGEVVKSHNIIFPHSHPTSHIPIPSPPEGEYGPIDEQAAQETQEGEAELMPEDQTGNSIDDPIHLLPDNAPSEDNSQQFLGIWTCTQLKKSNTPLVQLKSDHGPVQMEKQAAPHTMTATDNVDRLNVDNALNGPDAGQWQSAMDTEVAQLRNLDTFELVPLPMGTNNKAEYRWGNHQIQSQISCSRILTNPRNGF